MFSQQNQHPHPFAYDMNSGGTTHGLDEWVTNMQNLDTNWNIQ